MAKKIAVFILLTSAVVLDGVIRKAGEQVEVDQDIAKDLLNRGRGTLVEAHATAPEQGEVEELSEEMIDLAKLKKDELVQLATEYGVENPASFTKEQLIDKISDIAGAE